MRHLRRRFLCIEQRSEKRRAAGFGHAGPVGRKSFLNKSGGRRIPIIESEIRLPISEAHLQPQLSQSAAWGRD
jgi:hypothetical protein